MKNIENTVVGLKLRDDLGNEYSVFHTGNFDPKKYLPLTGGTISGNLIVESLLTATNMSVKNKLISINADIDRLVVKESLNAEKNATIKGNLSTDGNFSAKGSSSLNGSTTINSTLSVKAKTTLIGGFDSMAVGRIQRKLIVTNDVLGNEYPGLTVSIGNHNSGIHYSDSGRLELWQNGTRLAFMDTLVNSEHGNYLSINGGTMQGDLYTNQNFILANGRFLYARNTVNHNYPIAGMDTDNLVRIGDYNHNMRLAAADYIYCYAHFVSTDASHNLWGFGRIYNAVYNDYAELFETKKKLEVGDIIALDEESSEETYIKATVNSNCIVGVYSDSYAMLIGGKESGNKDVFEFNKDTHAPVGLAGRVMVKVKGYVKKGDKITISNEAGVGEVYSDTSINKQIIGIAVESSNNKNTKLVRMFIKNT